MKREIVIFICILLFGFLKVYPFQNDNIVIPDSLSKYSYDDLKNKFIKNHTDKNLSTLYINVLLLKGKKENNIDQIAYAYWRLGTIYYSFYNNYNLAHKYLDSCISISEKNKLEHILARAYFVKADLFNDTNQHRKELDFFLKAEKYYDKSNQKMGYLLNYNIGKLKYKLGENLDALKLFKEVRSYELKNDSHINDKKQYLNTLYHLVNAYSSNGYRDSVTQVIEEAYSIAKTLNDSTYITFMFLEGGNQFHKKNYKTAKDSLLKSIPYFEKKKNYKELLVGYHFLGKIYDFENKYSIADTYFKMVDSLFVKHKFAIPGVRGTYEELIKYSKNKNDIKAQLYYTEQLLLMDSIITEEYKYYSKKFYEDYDTPKLISEKEYLIKKLSKKNSTYENINYLLYLITIVVISIAVLIYRKQLVYKRRFQRLISKNQKLNNSISSNSKKHEKESIDINKDIINNVLNELDLFEHNEGYLLKKITLSSLSKHLNTNPKYLSKIINFYKEKSFNNYINDLRIEYIIDKIQTEDNFKKYSIKALAFEAGFNNSQSFSQYFYKKTGIYPSYFIKQLIK